MLDKIRAKVLPTSIANERQAVQAEIDRLGVVREELRLASAKMVLKSYSHPNEITVLQRDILKFSQERESVDETIQTLRERRREIDALTEPVAPKCDLVDTTMSPELENACAALDAARNDRHATLNEIAAAGHDGDSRRVDRLNARLGEIEDEIVDLRTRRAALLVPHTEKIQRQIQPIIFDAATQLLAAIESAVEAVGTLSELETAAANAGLHVSRALSDVKKIDRWRLGVIEQLSKILIENSRPEIQE